MFLSGHARLPPGTLRAALTYPHPSSEHDEQSIAQAMSDLGLAHLLPALDSSPRSDRSLKDHERRCLGFARAILHRPQWLVLNEALESLDVLSRERVETLLRSKLAGVGLINIGPESSSDGLFTRRLQLLPCRSGRDSDVVEARELSLPA